MKQKTPMQELIEWLNDENKKYIRQAKEESSLEILGYAFKIQDCIKHAEALLEKEKEVIIETSKNSYIAGYLDNQAKVDDSINFPKEYYNTNFSTKVSIERENDDLSFTEFMELVRKVAHGVGYNNETINKYFNQ